MSDNEPASKRTVFSWCLFDWANSAFTTLVVTFIYGTYFTKVIAADEITGTALWGRAIAISAILIAILSPLLGVAADRGQKRRQYLFVVTVIAVVGTAALTFVVPGTDNAVFKALFLFVIANVAFEVGMVFYNAFLPSITTPEKIGRISGFGWGLGYAGGTIAMFLALAVFVREEPLFGISTIDSFNVRATNLLVAGWYALFAIPMFLFVKDEGEPKGGFNVGAVFDELRKTVGEIRKFKQVAKFLVARLVFNDGLVTVFAFGGIYAAGTFGMELREVIQFGIALNVAAGLGAVAFGYIDDRVGGKTTIMVSLVALSASTILAVLAPTKMWLWIAGMGIGVFAGPNQSASRSLMARFVPQSRQTEFFGFFAFSGKVTSFLGPILLASATVWFGNQRAGVATVLIFFLVGGILLLSVSEEKGIKAAAE